MVTKKYVQTNNKCSRLECPRCKLSSSVYTLSSKCSYEVLGKWEDDGRSLLGKTVPEVLSTQDRGHSFSQYGQT